MPIDDNFEFKLHVVDSQSAARVGELRTPHGIVATPQFMPVGTRASVKGITRDDLRSTNATMILANTYHLTLRPGEDLIAELGGLHEFMGWDGPILTDSGGFQIYSLAQSVKITEERATFRSHIDGHEVHLSPEKAMQIQEQLGSDVAMVLDHVIALPNDEDRVLDAMQRSLRWAARCKHAHRRPGQALFGIVQGGMNERLRRQSCRGLVEIGFDGYAVGGLSVGESPSEMYRVLDFTVPELPVNQPRYLMGVGRPADLLEGIARGIDLFDCVMPTRNARNALAFTSTGSVRMKNLRYARDKRPLDERCPCQACRHSRAYLRHLFMAGEMLGPMLLTIHNLTYYLQLMEDARSAIRERRYVEFMQERYQSWAAESG